MLSRPFCDSGRGLCVRRAGRSGVFSASFEDLFRGMCIASGASFLSAGMRAVDYLIALAGCLERGVVELCWNRFPERDVHEPLASSCVLAPRRRVSPHSDKVNAAAAHIHCGLVRAAVVLVAGLQSSILVVAAHDWKTRRGTVCSIALT